MDSVGFQRELGVIAKDLLQGPEEALAATWNREAAGALDRIALQLCGLSCPFSSTFPVVYRKIVGFEED